MKPGTDSTCARAPFRFSLNLWLRWHELLTQVWIRHEGLEILLFIICYSCTWRLSSWVNLCLNEDSSSLTVVFMLSLSGMFKSLFVSLSAACSSCWFCCDVYHQQLPLDYLHFFTNMDPNINQGAGWNLKYFLLIFVEPLVLRDNDRIAKKQSTRQGDTFWVNV